MLIQFTRTFILCVAIAAIAVPTVSHAIIFYDGYELKELADAGDIADANNGERKEQDIPTMSHS